MRIANVVGTRPQIIKAAALQPALRARHDEVFIDTGQHWDDGMAGAFFAELGLRAPDRSLGIGGGSAAQQTALGGVGGDAVSPDAHYVESVKRQLVDAMLEYSRSLQLRPQEWLTVAARQAEEAPGQIEEPSVMVLRIQGADLAEFLAGRLTPAEVRRRVQVRGY